MVAPITSLAAKRRMLPIALLSPIALLGLSLFAAAAAQTAAQPVPSDRCEGTLCDLYYGSRAASGASGAAAAAPAPSPAPGGLLNFFGRGSGPANAPPLPDASATNGYMGLGAGGILGARQERCSGTLCDLYYGSSSPSNATGRQEASVAAAPAAEAAVPHRHIVHESETRPKCSSPTADPWRCYR